MLQRFLMCWQIRYLTLPVLGLDESEWRADLLCLLDLWNHIDHERHEMLHILAAADLGLLPAGLAGDDCVASIRSDGLAPIWANAKACQIMRSEHHVCLPQASLLLTSCQVVTSEPLFTIYTWVVRGM